MNSHGFVRSLRPRSGNKRDHVELSATLRHARVGRHLTGSDDEPSICAFRCRCPRGRSSPDSRRRRWRDLVSHEPPVRRLRLSVRGAHGKHSRWKRSRRPHAARSPLRVALRYASFCAVTRGFDNGSSDRYLSSCRNWRKSLKERAGTAASLYRELLRR
jgi:hypothetical protein